MHIKCKYIDELFAPTHGAFQVVHLSIIMYVLTFCNAYDFDVLILKRSLYFNKTCFIIKINNQSMKYCLLLDIRIFWYELLYLFNHFQLNNLH